MLDGVFLIVREDRPVLQVEFFHRLREPCEFTFLVFLIQLPADLNGLVGLRTRFKDEIAFTSAFEVNNMIA